jgi:imidazolonepropionase-like amidohydrolase
MHLHARQALAGGPAEDWWIADGVLTRRPQDGAAELPGSYLLCGLVDAHVHLTIAPRDPEPVDDRAALAATGLALQERAGVLALRDLGAPPGSAAPAPTSGPRVLAAGPMLAPRAFHPGLGTPTSPDEVVERARAVAAGGAPWVKVVADYPAPPSGHYLAPAVAYAPPLLRTLCDAVHAEGARVAIHLTGSHDVLGYAECGVDSIEHGTLLDEPAVEAMAGRGVAWTPTLATVVPLLEHVAESGRQDPPFPLPPAADCRVALERLRVTLPLGDRLGVSLLAGTDETPHGTLADEVALLVRFGVRPATAVAAAADGARAFLGLPGIAEGAPADLVLFDADPLADPGALAAPVAVVSRGVRVR